MAAGQLSDWMLPMSKNATNPEQLKTEWLGRLDKLIHQIEEWARELDWSTRRIDKGMDDSVVGPYRAPVLLLQHEVTRILVEPIARSSPGVDGVVDLYLMPAYDDVASLYYTDGTWRLHYMLPGQPTVPNIKDAESQPFSKESLEVVFNEMKAHAASTV